MAIVGRCIACTLLATSSMFASAALGPPAEAQTIEGTLLDLETGQPVALGLVLMFTETGDSVALDVTDPAGRFTLSSRESGSFVLLATAFGYSETPAGVFELGVGGVMEIEYRLAPQPLAIDELVVSLERPVLEHKLVRNGFVRRAQRGLGHFITPHDIEESPATSTEQLFTHVPGVRIGTVTLEAEVRLPDSSDLVTVMTPRPDIGETVQIRSPGGGWCTPSIYVDGQRTFYDPGGSNSSSMVTLSTLAPLATVEAIEVYRRAAEIPVEYSLGARANQGTCGVLVIWTRSGPVRGQVVAEAPADAPAEPAAVARPAASSPDVGVSGSPPMLGERIRLQLDPAVTARLGVPSPWEGTFLTVREGELVANDASLGRALAVPIDGLEELQVRRERGTAHAFQRGAIAGALFGVGMWRFLALLCRDACEGVLGSAWFPASLGGVGVGLLVSGQGPGTHWVRAPLPMAEPARGLPSGAPIRWDRPNR